jgi:parallel beta-helix repeat protein
MPSSLPRASRRSPRTRHGAPSALVHSLSHHVDLRALRWLVLGMMAAAALVIPFVAAAGHHSRIIARDSFQRPSARGWSNADTGGPWSYPSGAQAFSVQDGAGTIRLAEPGATASTILRSATGRDVTLRFSARLDGGPTGGGTTISAVLRHTDSAEYRLAVRFAQGGAFASIVRVDHGSMAVLGSEVRLAGVTVKAASITRFKAKVAGTSPATLSLQAWTDGRSKPSGWAFTVADAHGIGAAGAVGVRTSLDSTATAPQTISIDRLRAKSRDGGGPEPSPTHPATPTARPTGAPNGDPIAFDRFDRTVRNGWGSTDAGETYGLLGNAEDYSVSAGVGHLVLPPGQTRAATLSSAVARDADLSFRFADSRLPTDGSTFAYAVARRQPSGDEYRIKARVDASGAVYLHATRFVNGVESDLGGEVRVPGLQVEPGSFIWVRAQVVGSDPASIRIRAWNDGDREPLTWSYQQADGSVSLRSPGAVGLMAYVSSSEPTQISLAFDDFRAAAPSSGRLVTQDPEPTATPTASDSPTDTPAPTETTQPTDAPSPGPSDTLSPTPTAQPTDTPLPTPKPTAPPTPKPTPTPTPTPSNDPAETWYVSPSGSDDSDGSGAAPWLTLQHAADRVPAGGTVIVSSGTYAGFTMTRSGTNGDPITFLGDPDGPQPVLDGRVDGRLDVVRINGAHDVRISGFVVTGSQGGDYTGSGIRTENGASRIVISDNLIRNNHSYGVNSYASSAVTIRDNEVTGNEEGIQIARGGEGTRIIDNRVHDNDQMLRNTPSSVDPNDDAGATGIGFLKTTGHVVASGNYVWGNRAPSYDYTWDGSAFDIYGASNVTITDNVTWDNENVFETGTDPGLACRDNVFARNVSYGATTQGRSWGAFIRCGTDMIVANNTFVGIEGFVFSIGTDSSRFSGALDGLEVVNNLVDVEATGARVFGLTTDLPSSVRIDYNLARTSGQLAMLPDGRSTSDPDTFTAWTGYQVHGLAGNPRFTDPGDEDYSLRATSPAVDAGTQVDGITDIFSGAGPDIGRFERP